MGKILTVRYMWGVIKNAKTELQLFLVTTLAVTTAWLIGSEINKIDGLVAAIITIVTLRISLQASVSEGFIQVLGAAIGVSTALLTINLVGTSYISVALVTSISFIAAKILRLGEAGIINITITALIVLGPGLPTENAIDRTLGTLLGVGVAVAFSFIAHPTNPVTRTEEQVKEIMRRSGNFLENLAQTLSKNQQTTYGTFLKDSRILHSKLNQARNQAEEAVLYAKWSPLAPSEDAERAYKKFVAAEHIQVQIRSISRTLFDYSSILDSRMKKQLVSILHTASSVILNENIDANSRYQLRKELEQCFESTQKLSDRKLIAMITILTAVERIAESLNENSPAISLVPTPLSTTPPYDEMKKALSIKKRKKSEKK